MASTTVAGDALIPVSARADISASIKRADGRVVDLGLLTFSDSDNPVLDLIIRVAIWLKITYYARTGRRLLPGIIP